MPNFVLTNTSSAMSTNGGSEYQSVDPYKQSNGRKTVVYSAMYSRWFMAVWDGGFEGASTIWNEDTSGWSLYYQDRVETDEANWIKCTLVGPNQNHALEPKGCISPAYSLKFMDAAGESVNSAFLDNQALKLAESSTSTMTYKSHTGSTNGYDETGEGIDLVFDSTGVLHILQNSNAHLVYSRWSYTLDTNTFTQVNVNNPSGQNPYDVDSSLLPPMGNQGLIPRNFPHLPYHRIIFSSTSAMSMGWSEYMLRWSQDEVAYEVQENLKTAYQTNCFYSRLFIIDDQPKVYLSAVFLVGGVRNTGGAWLFGFNDVWSMYDYNGNLDHNKQGNSNENSIIHMPINMGINEICDNEGNYNTGRFVIWRPTFTNNNALEYKFVNMSNIFTADNYNPNNVLFESNQAMGIDVPYSGMNDHGMDMKMLMVYTPQYNERFIFLHINHHASTQDANVGGSMVMQHNIGKVSSQLENGVTWLFDPTLTTDTAEFGINGNYGEFINQTTGTAGFSDYLNFNATNSGNLQTEDNATDYSGSCTIVVNPAANTINWFLRLRNGAVLRRVTDIGAFEEAYHLEIAAGEWTPESFNTATTDLDLENPIAQPDEAVGNYRTLHTVERVPVSENKIPIITHPDISSALMGFWCPVEHIPQMAAIYDLTVQEVRITSAVMQFSLTREDSEIVTHVRFRTKQGSIFTNDFDDNELGEFLIEVPISDLDYIDYLDGENIERREYTKELFGFTPGATYYIAIKCSTDDLSYGMSNMTTVYLPPTFVNVPSKNLTVPMHDSSGALYIGLGNSSADKPQRIGRLSHSQFGVNFNRIAVEDSEVSSPAGSDSAQAFDNILPFGINDSTTLGLEYWLLGYNIKGTVLFIMHKDTGEIRKTNTLGVSVKAACPAWDNNVAVWDEDAQMIHIFALNPESLNATNSLVSYSVDYTPVWASSYATDQGNSPEISYIAMSGRQSEFEDGDISNITDFANSSRDFLKVIDIVYDGANDQIWLLADTEGEIVLPGRTCIISAPLDDETDELVFEDKMIPWNPGINATLNSNVAGATGDDDYYSQLYLRQTGHINADNPPTIIEGGISGLTASSLGLIFHNSTDDIDGMNPYSWNQNTRVYSASEFEMSVNKQNCEAHIFSTWHGPHQWYGNGGQDVYLQEEGELIPYGMIPVPHTLNINREGGGSDRAVGFYAEFVNCSYRHLYSTFACKKEIGEWEDIANQSDNWGDGGAQPSEYHCTDRTPMIGLKYVTTSRLSKGWSDYIVKTEDDSEDDLSVASSMAEWRWGATTGTTGFNSDSDFLMWRRNFECLDSSNLMLIFDSQVEYNQLSDINNAVMNNYMGAAANTGATSVVAVNSSEGSHQGTRFYAEELFRTDIYHDVNHTLTSNLFSWNAYSKPKKLTGTTSGTAEIRGKIEILFPDTTYTQWGVLGNDDSDRNLSLTITGIPSPWPKGGNDGTGVERTLFNKFRIMWGEPRSDGDPSADATEHMVDTAAIGSHTGVNYGVTLYNRPHASTDKDQKQLRTYDGEGTAYEQSYWGKTGLTSPGYHETITLLLNRRFQTSDSQVIPSAANVVYAIHMACEKADFGLSSPTQTEKSPLIHVYRKGSSGAEARTLVIATTLGADAGFGASWDQNTSDVESVFVSVPTITVTTYTNDEESHHNELFSTNRDALVALSSDADGNRYSDGGFVYNTIGYDTQYRTLSRAGTLSFNKLYHNIDPDITWVVNGADAQNSGHRDYALAEGEALTATPGSIIIQGGTLGTYHEGTCSGVTESGETSSDHNDNKDTCEANGGTFSRTGSSKFDPGKRYYYRLSYTYDGFQESPLSVSIWDFDMRLQDATAQSKGYDTLKLYIKLKDVPQRATHITIWRRDDDDEVLYRSVEQTSLAGGWAFDGVSYNKTITDKGSEGPSYEALTGLSSTIESSSLHYQMGCIAQNMLFVANAYVLESGEHYPNLLFRSVPGSFSIFNWPNDYCKLPNIPTAISAMGRNVYAWDDNNMYVIDPLKMYVQETFTGVGCLGKESVIVAEPGMFWFDKTNVYLLPRAGGIDYIGNKILTSEHGIGWQENKPDEPYKAIYDSKRKSFGMIQQFAPATYFMMQGTPSPSSSPSSTDVSTALNGYLDLIGSLVAGNISEEDYNSLDVAEFVVKSGHFRQLRMLQQYCMSKKYTKLEKRRKVKGLINTNKSFVNELSEYFPKKSPNEIIIFTALIVTNNFLKLSIKDINQPQVTLKRIKVGGKV